MADQNLIFNRRFHPSKILSELSANNAPSPNNRLNESKHFQEANSNNRTIISNSINSTDLVLPVSMSNCSEEQSSSQTMQHNIAQKSTRSTGSQTENFEENLTLKKNYPIGRRELTFYYIIWIVHSIAAFAIAIRTSNNSGKWLEHWMEGSDYLNGWKMDNSDLEWKLYRNTIMETIALFSIHSVVFYFAIRYLNRFCSIFLVTFWILLHWYMTSAKCMIFLGAHIVLTTLITYFTQRQSIAWILCITFVLKANDWAPFSFSSSIYYREFNLYLYTSIQVLNYCIYLTRNKTVKLNKNEVLKYLEYLFYPMYSVTLIVLYEDFCQQMIQLRTKITCQERIVPSIKFLGTRALRLVLWFLILDTLLHFSRFNAFFNSPFTMLTSLHNYESSLAYVAGQFFHTKYVVIFGVPSFFAYIDGMTPPGPPICISRVSKYSQMWRYFDQGLYQFLKNQVYIPLIGSGASNNDWRPKALSVARQVAATSTVFLFVLSWHGVTSNYFYWVILSAFELCVERIGRMINRKTNKFQETIGEANSLRLTAIAMLATVVPGIFGVFFFLGKIGIGDHIFSRVLVSGLYEIVTCSIKIGNAGFVMSHLFLIGYCFNHVCLHLEAILPHGPQKNHQKNFVTDAKKVL